jgi:hypothetical protein
MKTYNVVGDIAGNYLTLLALLDQMPKDAELICLGDPNDRGPRSKEVIEFLMKNGRTVQSNHAHMMTTEYRERANPRMAPRYYESGIWPESNGGSATMLSYTLEAYALHELPRIIPEAHINFLEQCPIYIETDDYVMTHAPCRQNGTLQEMAELGTGFYHRHGMDFNSEYSLIWNRLVPHRPNPELGGRINLFGHNSSVRPKAYTTQYPDGKLIHIPSDWDDILATKEKYPIYAIGLDTSAAKFLTGFNTADLQFYTQQYID